MDTDANLEIVLTIPKAIFLHSPDCEFAEVGAKSDIPYRNWFNLFKDFLMKNSTNLEIEALFKWWNGKVFSFDTTNNQGVRADDVESGMDEAELVFAAYDFPASSSGAAFLSTQHDNYNNEEDLVGTFDNLAITPDSSNQPLSSQTVASSSESRRDTLAEPPSQAIIVQPDKSATQNPAGKPKRRSVQKAGGAKSNGKGKQKAGFFDEGHEADLEGEELVGTEGPQAGTVNERNLRSTRRKR